MSNFYISGFNKKSKITINDGAIRFVGQGKHNVW
jgi:hypothetical protein